MKYLKKYENFSYDDIGIKKYFILKNTDSTAYSLCEIKIIHNEKYFRALELYKYYTVNNTIKKLEQYPLNPDFNVHFFSVDKDKNKIFYQSDNIEDCLNMLKSMTMVNKYNI